MARFYGVVGYVEDYEDSVDVIVEKPIERYYKGDLVRNSRKLENGEGINDNINISNQISIIADAYAMNHIFAMRYVRWMGSNWKVTSVDVEPPRLILTLGGLYHGETAQ